MERFSASVHAVAGVAEARHDIAVVVEVIVDRGCPDRHVGVHAAELLDAFGCGEKADEAHVLGAALLQPVDGGDGGVRGREHRIENDHNAVGEVGGGLEIILDGVERLRVAVEPDMGDARRRHQGQHAVEEADAGPQDRREDEFLAGDLRRLHARERGVDLGLLERQVARDLVAEQHPDLVEELPEALRRTALVPHQGQLVLDERMIDDGDALHGTPRLRSSRPERSGEPGPMAPHVPWVPDRPFGPSGMTAT